MSIAIGPKPDYTQAGAAAEIPEGGSKNGVWGEAPKNILGTPFHYLATPSKLS